MRKNKNRVKKHGVDTDYLKAIDPAEFPALNVFKGDLTDCLEDIAGHYVLEEAQLSHMARCDDCGGFDTGYPVGSITQSEGRIMYALIRTLKLERILEIGTLWGCSANHLAAALKTHCPEGFILSMDKGDKPTKIGSLISPELKDNVRLITDDLYSGLPEIDNNSIDLIFEDSAHLEETTAFCLEQAKRILKPGGWIILHDTLCATHVKGIPCKWRMLAGIDKAGMAKNFRHYIVDKSTYGMGICSIEK